MPHIALTKPLEAARADVLDRIRQRVAAGELETPDAIETTVERVERIVIPNDLTPVSIIFHTGGLP